MIEDTQTVFSAALALTPRSRAALAEKLWQSLDEQDQDGIRASWIDEIESRWAAYRRGEIQSVPAEEVFRSLPTGRKS